MYGKMNQDEQDFIGDFTATQGLVAAAIGIVVIELAANVGDGLNLDALLVSCGGILSAIWIFRPLWDRPWYWLTLTFIVAAHVTAILFFPMSNTFSGIRLAPLVAVDIIIVLAIVNLVAKLMLKRNG